MGADIKATMGWRSNWQVLAPDQMWGWWEREGREGASPGVMDRHRELAEGAVKGLENGGE